MGVWNAGSRKGAVLDCLLAVAAIGGTLTAVLLDFPVREAFAASDVKTLYASTWCFAHGVDAYSVDHIQQVYLRNGVSLPQSWFGHAAVYPPVTLALLAPLAALPMVAAIYFAVVVSAALFAAMTAALMRAAAREFGLGLPWRGAVAGLCAGGPLLGFALTMGNVSVASSALAVLAFAGRKRVSPWICGGALAVAIVLKPHLALWVLAGMVALPEQASRRVVVRAVEALAALTAVVLGVMAMTGTLAMQWRAYFAMLHAETAAGASMNAGSREPLPVPAQITSLASLIGFWSSGKLWTEIVAGAVLLGLMFWMVHLTRKAKTEGAAYLAVAAWGALGMLATYHRAHDGVLLLVAVPWVVHTVRSAPRGWHAWAAAGLYVAMSAGPNFWWMRRVVESAPWHSWSAFALLRQAALADLLLLVVLLLALAWERKRPTGSNA